MDKQLAKELEDLFIMSPPSILRKSLNEVFYSYLINTEILPDDFKEIATDIHILNNFFEKADEHYSKKGVK